jgi:PAS domain S-box-containing protein
MILYMMFLRKLVVKSCDKCIDNENILNQVSYTFNYIKSITEDNIEFNIEREKVGEEAANLLERLRTQKKEQTLLEQQRTWVSEGLGQFVELLQTDYTQKDTLFQQVLVYVVRYLKANQGGIFLLSEEQQYLDLIACYAYDKKRYTEKRIAVGEGLLGQCFLEAETTVYTNLPPFYTHITSGLGEATPDCLLLVPLKFNGEVMGVLEIASFHQFKPYEIEFLEKMSESLAAVYFNIQNAEKAQRLLEEAELREQMLKEQEEELRQNLEELQATQEEMSRKQKEVDLQSNMMKLIIDHIPFPVFVKDGQGRYALVNKAEATLLGMPEDAILMHDDSHFVKDQAEWEVIRKSDRKTLEASEPVELPVQSFTTPDGYKHMFKTTKIPFVNTLTGEKNILGVSVDLTEKLELERRLQAIGDAHSQSIRMKQARLLQKMLVSAERLIRGKVQERTALEEYIIQYDQWEEKVFGSSPREVSHQAVVWSEAKHLLAKLVLAKGTVEQETLIEAFEDVVECLMAAVYPVSDDAQTPIGAIEAAYKA